ncbi:hypothetical protein [Mycobacterium intracellulare]|uniref:hypothetical protein n=1 Tax=Mycobacterium intracellulare TaxID=1767 RepID=UPI0034D48EC2
MITAMSNDIRMMGPHDLMRFAAQAEDCTVFEGEMPPKLRGGISSIGSARKRLTKRDAAWPDLRP